MEITLDELVQEMNQLEQQMQKFEWKYSIKSAEFYKLVLAGVIEESFELHEWLGLYKLWLEFREKYLELLKSPSPLLKLAQPIEDDFFKAEGITA
ncbi:MAG: hypothetical protein ONB46_10300 [candidate division KSB1 bacterium]|nr:hypothetical protein [candidate division KSB1 bacterium]MDZ7366195.1 hypothetical protein [candidate division KSB1 bacterium]MDZ7404413.1 hypothetical protein [candidate division KSB1 bacterium]